jgi:hypothetical protein
VVVELSELLKGIKMLESVLLVEMYKYYIYKSLNVIIVNIGLK